MSANTLSPAVPMPAEATLLRPTFDADRMLAELAAVRTHAWDRQRVYDDKGVGSQTDVDWRCLALRSPGGDGDRTDPGGPGAEDFADTEWLDQLPYIRQILGSIPAPLHAVRLMALGPDTVGMDHSDPKYGPRWGVVRLHVPVVTNPAALLVLDGVEHAWQPGEFWFGDFSQTHRVQNHGDEARTHLVIDALVVPGLARVFPQSWASYFADGDVLFNRQACPQRAAERARSACRLEIPASFGLWESEANLAVGEPTTLARVHETGSGLELALDTGQRLGLVHLGQSEYRFAGWSEERTLQLFTDGPTPSAVLRTRAGRQVQQLTVPVTPDQRR